MSQIYSTPLTQQAIDSVGDQIRVVFTRTSPTNGVLTWVLPRDLSLYNGIVATLKTSQILPENFPVDGQTYIASQDLGVPQSMIGDAQVVGAMYGDKISTSINVVGLNPDSVYFASGHPVTNTLQYYTRGNQSYALQIDSNTYSGDIAQATSPPLSPSIGQVYYNTLTGATSMWTGTGWVLAGVDRTLVGIEFPEAPYIQIGQFFYHEVTKLLYCWTGTGYSVVNTTDAGTPMYSKAPGTDGSFNERANLITIIKRQLGWPRISVELDEEHYQIAINNALQEFRRRADNAYSLKYFAVRLEDKQQKYYLNDPVAGTDKITDIVKIWRVSGLGLIAQGENGIYGQSFLVQLYTQGVVDLTSIYMMNAYAEQFSQIFAGEIAFRFNEATRLLETFRQVIGREHVLLEAMTERTEQELLVDRYSTQWIQGWAVSEAKMMLGHIRSKFASLPGAGGGINLNGSELLQSAFEDQTELLRQIMDMEVGNGGYNAGNYSFVIG